MKIKPIAKGVCKDLPTSDREIHKCLNCNRLSHRPRRVAHKDWKCQLCLQDKFNSKNN